MWLGLGWLLSLLVLPAPVQESPSVEAPDPAERLQAEVQAEPPEGEAAPETPQETPPAAPTRVERSLATLETLVHSREIKRAALEEVRAQLDAAPTEDQRTSLEKRATTLQQELDKLERDFESIATGIDMGAFEDRLSEAFDIREELQELFRPIIEELKAATEAPRQIEHLRAQLEYFEDRERLARNALLNLEALLTALEGEGESELGAGLEDARAAWQARLKDIESREAVARFHLDQRLSDRSSILETTQEALATFFRTRGLNLLLALVAFLAVMFVFRSLYRFVTDKLVHGGHQEGKFYARLLDVLYLLFVGGAAVLAALLVLYASGDWVLLGLALLFLLGLAWASKTAVPIFLEQIRLLLNFGTVRERERVVLDGIPYRVSKISLYTLLSNPALAGGVRRLPIGDLIHMRSRTASKGEIWFPCKRGDWVLLSDGTRGRVTHQSPDTVQLEMLGGTLVTYPSTSFLKQFPKNISEGFRLQIRFGIDYAHQAISTTTVPEILTARVRAGMTEAFGAGSFESLVVEFLEAGSSSLDYVVIADIPGSGARDYEKMQRTIQRLCVDSCNDEGWVIPFTQVTLHHQGSPE